MNNTFTYNGKEYTASKELQASIEALIALAKPVKATKSAPQPKAETVKQTASPKGKKSKGVLKVDKYGNEWIADYDDALYQAEKARRIAAGTYDKSKRSEIYRSLGWIR